MTLKGLTVNTIVHTLEKENPETRQTFPGLFLYAWATNSQHNLRNRQINDSRKTGR